MGERPERQRGRTVNPLAYAFVGPRPTSTTTLIFKDKLPDSTAARNNRKEPYAYKCATCSPGSAEHQIHRFRELAIVDVLEQVAVDVERHGDGRMPEPVLHHLGLQLTTAALFRADAPRCEIMPESVQRVFGFAVLAHDAGDTHDGLQTTQHVLV